MTSGGCFEGTCDKIAENVGKAMAKNAQAAQRNNEIFPQTPACPANQVPKYELDYNFGWRVASSCIDGTASSYNSSQPENRALAKLLKGLERAGQLAFEAKAKRM